MLRFLVKFLLLAIILIAGIVFSAQWKLENDLARFAQTVSPFLEFDYESAKVSYTGEIRINSINAYVNSIDANIEIGQLRFFTGNLIQLAFFESDLSSNKLPENAYLILQDVLVPFDAKLIKALKQDAPVSSQDLLETAYCGEIEQFGIEQIEAMGYDYLSFSSDTFYLLDKYSGSIVFNGAIDVEDAFKVEYQVNVGSVMAWLESLQQKQIGRTDKERVTPELSLLEFREKDRGFNLRKAEYCAMREEIAVEEYYSGHVTEVEKLLGEVGIQLSDEFKQLYLQMIQPESNFHLFIKPKANFEFSGLKYYTYEELLDLSGLQVTINDKPVKQFISGWSYDKYSKISELKKTEKRKKAEQRAQYKSVFITRSFQKIPVSAADGYIDYRVKVKREDGRIFEGKLTRTSEKDLWVIVRSREGAVTLPVNRKKISSLEVFKEVPKG